MLKKRGNTLVEVLIASAILGVVGKGVYSLLNTQIKFSQQAGDKRLLLDLLSQNVTEMNTKRSQDLPKVGSCFTRYYDSKGKFIEEKPLALLSATECKQPNPLDDRIKVTIKIEDSSAIDATFDPSAHLKLPKYVPTVKQVQVIVGMGQASKDKANQQPYSVTVFRRDA